MKRNLKILLIATFMVTAPLLIIAQPHPNGGNNPNAGGSTNNPVGPSAPIGNGTFILLALAAAYASRKVHELRETTVAE